MNEFYKATKKNTLQFVFFFLVIIVSAFLLTTPYYMLSMLPGLALIFMFVIMRFPYFGFYAIIFLIPFGAYRGLGGQFGFVRLHWIIAACLILLIFFKQLFKKGIPGDVRSNLWPLLCVFFVVNLISALLSSYMETSFKDVALLVVSCCFISLNLIFISQNGFRKTLPSVLIWSVTIGSFLAVIGNEFELSFFTSAVGSARGVGGSTDPNNMSLMIIFILPLLVYRFLYEQRIRSRVLAAVLIFINLFALVITYSRGGALILVLTVFLIFIEHVRKIKPKHLGIIIAFLSFVLVVTLLAVPGDYWQRQKSLTEWQDAPLKRRTSYLYAGFDIFKRDPLLGAGPGAFRYIYAQTDYARKFERKGKPLLRYAHNTYLEILAGTGLVGLFLFLAVLFVACKNFNKAKKNFFNRNDQQMAALVGTYRVSYLSLLLYLFIFSDIYHKYLLLSLPLSQVALNLSCWEEK